MTETTEEMMKRLNAARMTPVVICEIDPNFDDIPTQTPAHQRTMPVFVAEGYDSLFVILCRALHQAQAGKGKERHANVKPFDQQPIMAITDLVGMGFQTGQAIKKTVEAHGMVNRNELDAAERELLGAINYLAAAVLRINQISVNKMEKN